MGTGLLNLLPSSVTVLMMFYLSIKILDMITGVMKSWKNENWKSRKMKDGLIRWIGEMIAVIFVILIDIVLGLNFLLCISTLGLFIFNEGGSLCENLVELGVNLPSVVTDKLEVFNSKKGE